MESSAELSATPLGADVHLLDTQMGGYDGITAAYLIRSSRPALVETGAARSAQVVVDELAALGVGADDLATIVVTHIHLDTPEASAISPRRSRRRRSSSTSAARGTSSIPPAWSPRRGGSTGTSWTASSASCSPHPPSGCARSATPVRSTSAAVGA